MTMNVGKPKAWKWLLLSTAILVLGLGAAWGQKQPAANEASSVARRAPAQGTAADYAGQETCIACHEDQGKQMATTVHAHAEVRGAAFAAGCETCHGPGKAHADAGGGKGVGNMFTFRDVSAAEKSAPCLRCHEYGEEHSNFARSQHSLNDVSCVDCHSPHSAKQGQYLLVDRQPLLCYSCHTEIKPEFSKPFHHRVNEGLVRCTDCHNEHGGFLTKLLRSAASQDEVCVKCHVEKAGPFVFEHAPVKTEGCAACHTPHGSSNPRLLHRSQVNLLCLECHTLTSDSPVPGLPSFHNQAAKYQACTMCHTQIHGSNFSNFFFK
jgi:DmsE family decaheme c-type cytochrome